MKKLIFLATPLDISSSDIEMLREEYTRKGFDIQDPFKILDQLNSLRVETGQEYDSARFTGTCVLKLTDCDGVVLSSGWEKDELCNLLLRVADMGEIPVWREKTNIRVNFSSKIKTKLGKGVKDDRILIASKSTQNEPEFY